MRPNSLLTVLSLSLLFSGNVFGQVFFPWSQPAPAIDFGDKLTNAETLALIDVLDHKTWKLSSVSEREAAAKLPMSAKYALYEKYKTDGAWGLANIYVGAGSFIQGDPATGLVGVLGFGSYMGSIALGNSAITPTSTRTIWTVAAGSVAAGCILYALIRPWFFADERNKSLRVLLFTDDPSLKSP